MMVGSAALSAYSQYQSGQAQANAADANARIADAQAVRSEGLGAAEAGRIRAEGTKAAAEARAALAGSGVDVSSGTPVNLFAASAANAELDAQTAKENAALEAWGHRYQAAEERTSASMARRNSYLGPLATVVGAGAQIAGYKNRR